VGEDKKHSSKYLITLFINNLTFEDGLIIADPCFLTPKT